MGKVPISKSYGSELNETAKQELTARIDLKPSMALPDGVTLGTKLVVEVRGEVTAMRGGEMTSYKDSKGKKIESVYPGSLTVTIKGLSFEIEGEFDGMED